MTSRYRWSAIFTAAALWVAVLSPTPVLALETTLTAPGATDELRDRLLEASSAMSAEARGLESPQELLAASISDYRTLVQVMYDEGFFSPVVNIRLNGVEAAAIEPLNVPRAINRIEIAVQTGPPFRFGRAEVAPQAPDTVIPESFASGQTATTGAIKAAAGAGVDGWRQAGHAKAHVGDQRIVANHQTAILDAEIAMQPGPKLTFGDISFPDDALVRAEAMAKIAGFPTGETYHPDLVQKVGTRLRRTGAFRSVSIKENEHPNPDGTLDFDATIIDMPQRRISFGIALSSSNGLDVSAKWTHRNLWGAAEKLQFEATVRNIGGQEDIDGRLGLRLDRPATLGPDDNTFYQALIERRNRTHYNLTRAVAGIGVRRVFSDYLVGEASLNGGFSISDDAFGSDRKFSLISVPARLEWDKRNDPVNTTKGFYLDSTVTPFTGFSNTESGIQFFVDGRGYLSLTSSNSIVLAGRLQLGSVVGASLEGISPEYLFFSGGAGTVRGQPYESLGIPINGGVAGGKSILALAAEVRGKVTEKISLVGFFDIGIVDSSSFVDNDSPTHSGAGLGVRYDLGGFGPLRLDLAYPVDGVTSDGLQFYLGIGQAF